MKKIGDEILLYNVAPNGMQVDRILLTTVSNADNSGIEFLIEHIEDFGENNKIKIGHCDLILGNIMFDDVDDSAKYIGISHKAIALLVNWISENIEPYE